MNCRFLSIPIRVPQIRWLVRRSAELVVGLVSFLFDLVHAEYHTVSKGVFDLDGSSAAWAPCIGIAHAELRGMPSVNACRMEVVIAS